MSVAPPDATMLDHALAYAARGWPVLPLHTWNSHGCTCGHGDCTSPAKHPRIRSGLKDASTDPDTIAGWWQQWPNANIGIRTGVAFDVLDIDGDEGFDTIIAVEQEHGEGPVGPTSHTGGGGLHRLYQPTGVGNRAGLLEHVDWRGANGYIVAPPSLHASGQRYQWAEAPLDGTAPLEPVTGWLRDILFPPTPEPRPATSGPAPSGEAAAKYARKALDAEVGELIRTTQPGRNAQLNQSGFNMYQLVAGGDISDDEVTQVLRAAAIGIGLGEREIDATLDSARHGGSQHPRTVPALSLIHGTSPPKIEPLPVVDVDDGPAADVTGWEPVDVAALLAGDLTIPPPSLYQRTDSICLLYAGKLHAFNGEPESGKSWVAQHATVQASAEGLQVTYIDFEDSPQSVLGRLLSLGADPQRLAAQFTYLQPDQPLSAEASQLLREHFREHRPQLVVIDGVTEAMSTLGLDPLDNADTAKFFRVLPKALARLGAAVVLVDHVVKDKEQRGRWAIGSQHKMAALTGAAYTIEIATPFGRNKHGIAKILVMKDRPGYIRQHAGGSLIAEFHLISTEETVTAELRPASAGADGGPVRYTGYMERISLKLEGSRALSTTELKAVVGGKSEYVTIALRALAGEGYVSQVKEGQTTWNNSIRPFREPTETDEVIEDAF